MSVFFRAAESYYDSAQICEICGKIDSLKNEF